MMVLLSSFVCSVFYFSVFGVRSAFKRQQGASMCFSCCMVLNAAFLAEGGLVVQGELVIIIR